MYSTWKIMKGHQVQCETKIICYVLVGLSGEIARCEWLLIQAKRLREETCSWRQRDSQAQQKKPQSIPSPRTTSNSLPSRTAPYSLCDVGIACSYCLMSHCGEALSLLWGSWAFSVYVQCVCVSVCVCTHSCMCMCVCAPARLASGKEALLPWAWKAEC